MANIESSWQDLLYFWLYLTIFKNYFNQCIQNNLIVSVSKTDHRPLKKQAG